MSSWSEGPDPAPLLVLLHGDWGNDAAALQVAWEPIVAAQGISLLSLACPRDKGCQGSFWKWNGPPEWIDEQVTALATKRAVDRTRMWIAGWSGGATYIGFRALELEKRFSAFVIHGGGSPPGTSQCAADADKASAYFLVGSNNPYHSLQVGLRDYLASCHQETQWNVLSGGDHDVEWKALSSHGPEIVRFLLAHPRVAVAVPAPTASTPPIDAAVEAAPPPIVPTAAPAVVPPSRSGCGCATTEGEEWSSAWGASALALTALVSFARARSRRARPGPPETASRR